jgi:hypothetical protein
MTTVPRKDWIKSHQKTVAAALGLALMAGVAFGSFWFGWDWKALIGWKALVGYINPTDATGRKDAVQVYAVIVAGVVAAITAAVGLANLRLTRRNLEQQRELEAQRADEQRKLEAQRAQGTALQAYYEQIGKLLTEYDLRTTDREDIRELARGQTLTVLQEVNGKGKGSLLTFLHGAGLISKAGKNPAVALTAANLRESDLRRIDLRTADLQEADLQGADLFGASLYFLANLQGANLQGARVANEQLAEAISLEGATMPDGIKHD